MFEPLIIFLAAVWFLGLPVVLLILSVTAFVRSWRISKLERRLEEFEEILHRGVPATPAAPLTPLLESAQISALEPIEDSLRIEPAMAVTAGEPFRWELLIGQKAFGWIAVVLGVFAAAFFLRYAYDNNWIGPLGRVAVGEIVGSGLAVAGLGYFRRGARLFSQMLSACGVVVLYLATYSAFGFYRLLPSHEAGAFLAVIIALSMIASVLYDSLAVALVAVLGGVLTPLLLSTGRDSYAALFCYLGALNLGVGAVLLKRVWPAIGSLTLAGTHILFWIWYAENYHPEKLAWAIGFQAFLYGLYLVQDVVVQLHDRLANRWETTIRMLLNAVLGFTALYVLLGTDYAKWMGTAALAMATIYALIAKLLLESRGRQTIELLAATAIAFGFMALAVPLETDARWVALGWAASAAALWWFGMRVQAGPLRGLAAVMAIASVTRLVAVDLFAYRDDYWAPICNPIALPSIAVAVCLLGSVAATRRYLPRVGTVQQLLAGTASLAIVVVLWLVLSVDLHHYLDLRGQWAEGSDIDWPRLTRMSLSVLWTLYASALLAIGFRWHIAALRWLAIAFFAVTVGKVFLLDMVGLKEIYRIVAFIVLAVVLGIAARVYQRLGFRKGLDEIKESSSHAGI